MIFEFSKKVDFFAIFGHLGVFPPPFKRVAVLNGALRKTSTAPSPFLGPNLLPEKKLGSIGDIDSDLGHLNPPRTGSTLWVPGGAIRGHRR